MPTNNFKQYNRYMDYFKEYNEQKKIDVIVWRSIPTTFGYWLWLGTTFYLWRFKSVEIDISATIGLGVGILIWLVSKLLLSVVGINLINMNLWENCGCGCLAKLIAIPQLPYIGIGLLGFWLYKAGNVGAREFVIGVIVAWLDWFLLSYLDTYIDLNP
jgi:hypothetical protein